MNEEQIDRAMKIGQLIELCGKMGGVKAFEPITKLAHEALRELNEELAPEPEPYEEVEVEGIVGDNPPPAYREPVEDEIEIHYDDQGQRITNLEYIERRP